MPISENKRIALNTGVLYIKLILSIFIGLYTSRIILQALGASDYGLYTVVGGIVSMMNFLGTTMVSVTYRYIIVELGKGEHGNPNKVFNTSLCIHIILALLLILVGETFGIYYIKDIANFAQDKIDDAIFVLHMSLVATALNILSIPYNGLIIAREKFVFTALVEIGRSIIKLILVIALTHYIGNRLRMFSIIVTFYTIILPISLFIYCNIRDKKIIQWAFNTKREDYKDILKFAFWIMIGAIAAIGQNQGSNMIINLFFNTTINAAFGIGFQINNYVMMFVQSLNQATVPQIMKNQNGQNSNRSLTLIYGISKYAFFIMFVIAIPLILNLDFVLKAWLIDVPPYTKIFATLLLICGLIRCLGAGFDSAIQATGKIQPMQIFYSCAYLSVLPVAYFLYRLNFPVYSILICTIIAACAVLFFQTTYLRNITQFNIKVYTQKTIYPCFTITILSLPLWGIRMMFSNSFSDFLITSFISFIWITSSIILLGLNKEEKQKIRHLINQKLSHTTRHEKSQN